MAKINIKTNVDGTATLVSNDGSHGAHDENNLDDGSTSQFALDLAAQMKKFGFETTVSRLE